MTTRRQLLGWMAVAPLAALPALPAVLQTRSGTRRLTEAEIRKIEDHVRALVAAQATRQRGPNQRQIDWVMDDPRNRATVFDAEFGSGAYTKAASAEILKWFA